MALAQHIQTQYVSRLFSDSIFLNQISEVAHLPIPTIHGTMLKLSPLILP